MNFIFRKMTLDDLEQVVAIDQISFSLPWPARSFFFEYDNPVSRCWVADLDGRVIAMMVGWLFVDDIHIATFATHPDFRRQGIGKALFFHTLKSAKAEGARTAFLEVRESNIAAIEMYRQFGFIENGRRKGYYKDNQEDAILMSLGHLPEDE
ncbi:MAG: ribosomal protein S18-alanine N-acetyltransferase [Chloroflexi bacterium]|nr:ribosomal protein S18-alanine N-acetyltransferase [Chloroflexota bacterium]